MMGDAAVFVALGCRTLLTQWTPRDAGPARARSLDAENGTVLRLCVSLQEV